MGTDDFASGMMGIIGTTALIGVGAAAGMATVRMIDRMGNQGVCTPERRRAGEAHRRERAEYRRKRASARKNKYY